MRLRRPEVRLAPASASAAADRRVVRRRSAAVCRTPGAWHAS
eukprot:ctg_5104.g647